ncbi:MAG: hypothetical protein R2715_02985 [Ilumatobacteraceae bacterium]
MKKDVLVFEEPGDLRRLVIAVVVTIAALPFLWSGHSDAPDSVATIGATVSDGMELSGMEASRRGTGQLDLPRGSAGAVHRDHPTERRDHRCLPALPENTVSGLADYQRWTTATSADHPCGTTFAPFGARVVVTNVDNGYRVSCTNVSSKELPPGRVILLDTSVMLELADLSDSPISVTLSW